MLQAFSGCYIPVATTKRNPEKKRMKLKPAASLDIVVDNSRGGFDVAEINYSRNQVVLQETKSN